MAVFCDGEYGDCRVEGWSDVVGATFSRDIRFVFGRCAGWLL